VPNFTTPHSNSLPQGEREVRLELRSDDKIFCRIRVKSPIYGLQAMRAAGYVFKRRRTHFPICALPIGGYLKNQNKAR
jgi:hypothetical protein